MTLMFDGVDVIGYMQVNNIGWGFDIIDGPNAGEKQDGTGIPNKINTKRKLKLKCRVLSLAEAAAFLPLLNVEQLNVTITDPMVGADTTFTMRTTSVSGTSTTTADDDWEGITFTLNEV